jgi:Flp pilus assembly pilin Flp
VFFKALVVVTYLEFLQGWVADFFTSIIATTYPHQYPQEGLIVMMV